ncbi:MAG TPA: calcium/proton exchanger [Gemmatimonadaceae bacterium]|nr:calcium/proton exchanger [Gemmatimonadaceae bacterium]
MSWLLWLLLAAPVAIGASLLHAAPLVVFAASAIAIIPLAWLLGRATEELSARTGPTLGGLVNASLGNLAELIIAGLALRAGLTDLVKASITGSIIGNLLLVLGAAQLAGGLKYRTQKFNPNFAGTSVSLLVIAAVGLIVPTLFLAAHPDPTRAATVRVSEFVAGFLIVGYALYLVYSMGTHRSAFDALEQETYDETPPASDTPQWTMQRTIFVLVAVAGAIGWMSELLVGATEATVHTLGLSSVFVGLVLIPIIGNAAEHSSAVLMARKNRMDLAASIAIGSSVQVALFVAPVLVFVGLIVGHPLDLAFGTFEVASVTLAVWITSAIVLDAESNWLEGAFLLLVYGILAVAFFYF